jgi:hypothetical protein
MGSHEVVYFRVLPKFATTIQIRPELDKNNALYMKAYMCLHMNVTVAMVIYCGESPSTQTTLISVAPFKMVKFWRTWQNHYIM